MAKGLTYKSAGVDVEKANEFVAALAKIKGKVGKIGGFGGLFPLPKGYKHPLLVGASDGVGTKLLLANLADKHNTVGIDLVAMNVNDVITLGARPLFFLDYIATGKLDKGRMLEVVKGIVAGCSEAGCVLLGGETAEMPGMYKAGDYDLAGFCVGIVEKKKVVNGSTVKIGDKIIGLASSGLHSNGYSLVRKVFTKELKARNKELLKELLRPTRIYVKPILSLLKEVNIKAMAHITGGGFYDNIPRVLPKGKCAKIEKGSWPIPRIFSRIRNKAKISEKEMFSTFNMGIGMALVVSKEDVGKVIKRLSQYKQKSWIMGEVIAGKREVKL